jgi:hypothetical protein
VSGEEDIEESKGSVGREWRVAERKAKRERYF